MNNKIKLAIIGTLILTSLTFQNTLANSSCSSGTNSEKITCISEQVKAKKSSYLKTSIISKSKLKSSQKYSSLVGKIEKFLPKLSDEKLLKLYSRLEKIDLEKVKNEKLNNILSFLEVKVGLEAYERNIVTYSIELKNPQKLKTDNKLFNLYSFKSSDNSIVHIHLNKSLDIKDVSVIENVKLLKKESETELLNIVSNGFYKIKFLNNGEGRKLSWVEINPTYDFKELIIYKTKYKRIPYYQGEDNFVSFMTEDDEDEIYFALSGGIIFD